MRHAKAARLDKIPGTEYCYCGGKDTQPWESEIYDTPKT